jgi:hypothetical protein
MTVLGYSGRFRICQLETRKSIAQFSLHSNRQEFEL